MADHNPLYIILPRRLTGFPNWHHFSTLFDSFPETSVQYQQWKSEGLILTIVRSNPGDQAMN